VSDPLTPGAPAAPTAGDGLPAFRRATAEDALDFAQAAFVSGDRIDMGALAEQLSIGRTTLHRWFGTREQLLERVIVRLTHEFGAHAQTDLTSDGLDGVLEFIDRMIASTVGFAPARAFVIREPQPALRILIAEHGAVQAAIVEEILSVAARLTVAEAIPDLHNRVKLAVQVGTTLQWSTFAIGDEPDPERLLDVVRMLITGS
jgi:AcrR family transcriptional regulator